MRIKTNANLALVAARSLCSVAPYYDVTPLEHTDGDEYFGIRETYTFNVYVETSKDDYVLYVSCMDNSDMVRPHYMAHVGLCSNGKSMRDALVDDCELALEVDFISDRIKHIADKVNML